MENTSKLVCLLAALAVTSGCAHQGGAAQQTDAASIAEIGSNCRDESGSDRPVRNHFKKARRIGRPLCNADR